MQSLRSWNDFKTANESSMVFKGLKNTVNIKQNWQKKKTNVREQTRQFIIINPSFGMTDQHQKQLNADHRLSIITVLCNDILLYFEKKAIKVLY